MGADENGKIQALETDWSVDHGPYCEFGDLVTMRGSQFMGAGYKIDNIRGAWKNCCYKSCMGISFQRLWFTTKFICFRTNG